MEIIHETYIEREEGRIEKQRYYIYLKKENATLELKSFTNRDKSIDFVERLQRMIKCDLRFTDF